MRVQVSLPAQMVKEKVLVIVGLTATGKSDLAVNLALKFNGEVVSADSRQVYKGMDLGSGKITKKEMRGIPHHMLDIVKPNSIFNTAKYKIKAQKIITDILKRDKLPIICGGTGFYIDTLVRGLNFPEVKPNRKLRAKLENKSTDELFTLLKMLDPVRAGKIDRHNKVRLIRAIEIAQSLGSVPKVESSQTYDPIYIGLDLADSELKRHIETRLKRRLKAGMVHEVERLHQEGISYRRLESFGLEYKNCALFLQNKIDKEIMIQNILRESFQYAKRQRTWFKRNKDIKWYQISSKTNKKIIGDLKVRI